MNKDALVHHKAGTQNQLPVTMLESVPTLKKKTSNTPSVGHVRGIRKGWLNVD